MLHEFAAVFFIDQSCLIEPSGVLADGFFICSECFDDILQSDTIALSYNQQYLNAIMVCYTFEMSLHLFRCFNFAHIRIVLHHTNILKFIGMLFTRTFLYNLGYYTDMEYSLIHTMNNQRLFPLLPLCLSRQHLRCYRL